MSKLRAQVLSPSPENLKKAARHLQKGDVVAVPTETVYGLAGSAFHEGALLKIFETKERPKFDPLIVHVYWQGYGSLRSAQTAKHPSLARLGELNLTNPALLSYKAQHLAEILIRSFWPGPLTLILPKVPQVPDLVTSGLSSVALRMPRHPVAQELIQAAGPLAAPSANRFGRISPTSSGDVLRELGDRIDLILDGGPCDVGVESTVLNLSPEGKLELFRPGGTPVSDIERVTGEEVLLPRGPQAGISPGLLAQHYSPRTPMRLLPAPLRDISRDLLETLLLEPPAAGTYGLLVFQGDPELAVQQFQEKSGKQAFGRVLSRSGSLAEAARNLFAELRTLDSSGAAIILAEPCPTTEGLGHAISDRLRRAQHSRN